MTEQTKKKHAGGRPRKELKDIFPKNWKDIIFKMANDGASDVEIRAHFLKLNGMSASAIEGMWEKLKERELEFNRTLLIAKEFCHAWWVKKGQDKLSSKYFRDYTWLANMKNRFGWRDKTEIEHTAPDSLIDKFSTLTVDALLKRANELTGNKPAS